MNPKPKTHQINETNIKHTDLCKPDKFDYVSKRKADANSKNSKVFKRSFSFSDKDSNFELIDSQEAFHSCNIDKETYDHDSDVKVNFNQLIKQAIAFKIDSVFWSNYQEERELNTSYLEYQASKYISIDSQLVTTSDLECSLCYR